MTAIAATEDTGAPAWVKDGTVPPPQDLDTTLVERGSRYGIFTLHAKITQELKATMHKTPGWERLSDSQKESLEMVQHKVGRILNGDPNYADSWVDIAGYTQLIVKELDGTLV